jgi:hypothetical protein
VRIEKVVTETIPQGIIPHDLEGSLGAREVAEWICVLL